ncbi:MAG: hypothetical protein K6F04_01035, partial [bacterium]|nr:hypothetical protein [bacterium]
MPDNMLKIREYNMLRFRKIYEYLDMCNQLMENNLDTTAYLYIEAFNADYLKSTFYEETNLLHLAKSFKFPHIDPEDPENIFNLTYYIVESTEVGFDLNFIRNCMDLFVADDKELAKYYRAALKEYDKRRSTEIFYAEDPKKFKEDMIALRMSLSSLFSMKCSPDNVTLDQSIEESIKRYELEHKDELKKKNPTIKNVGPYDFDSKKFNPLDNGPKNER